MKLLERLRHLPSPIEVAHPPRPSEDLTWTRDEFQDPVAPEAFEPIVLVPGLPVLEISAIP